MATYIIVCTTQHQYTRCFSTERKALVYLHKLERDGLIAHMVITAMNKEY